MSSYRKKVILWRFLLILIMTWHTYLNFFFDIFLYKYKFYIQLLWQRFTKRDNCWVHENRSSLTIIFSHVYIIVLHFLEQQRMRRLRWKPPTHADGALFTVCQPTSDTSNDKSDGGDVSRITVALDPVTVESSLVDFKSSSVFSIVWLCAPINLMIWLNLGLRSWLLLFLVIVVTIRFSNLYF